MQPASQNRRQKPLPSKLSVLDRLEFGAIAAFFGLVIGGLIAFAVWWFAFTEFGGAQHCGTWLVWFSVGYFFVVGALRGADSAETIVVGLVAGIGAALGGVGVVGGVQTNGSDYGWRPSMWWSVVYFVGVGLIVWLAK